MEQHFGRDFGDVRVHADGNAGGAAQALHADAYTTGRDVVFAAGRYDPNSKSGLQLLGHELAHVVQQSEGGVQPTAQAKGVALNDDASLERAADEHGDAVADAADRGTGQAADEERCPTCRGGSEGGTCKTCGTKTGPVQRQATTAAACHGTNRTTSPEHLAIQLHYTATIDPTGVREYAIPGGSSGGNVGYADIASPVTGAIYELKPYSPTQITAGLTQVAGYVAAATASCGVPPTWHPGFAYPDSVIPFGNLELVAKQYNNPGLILYYTRKKQQQPDYQKVLEVVLVIGLSLATIAVIIAALADPEPATKLAAAGLSVAMIALLFEKLGLTEPPYSESDL